jgi:tetratricopeptide (TPR) repeat protein
LTGLEVAFWARGEMRANQNGMNTSYLSMNIRSLIIWVFVFGVFVSAFLLAGRSLAERQPQSGGSGTREEAYRTNNIGVALLEQFKHKEGAEAFRNALKIDPKLNLAHINLSIALFNVPDLPAAQREAQNAANLNPGAPQPYYILGLIAKVQSRLDEALTAFQRVLKFDPNDVGTNINVGQIYSQQRKYPEAIAAFRVALAAEPYNATALYSLGQALMRAGQREEGQSVTERFKQLRERGSATTIGQNYLEQGRYAEAVASTGAEPELVDRTIPAVTFTDATAQLLSASTDAVGGSASPVFGRQFKTSNWNDASRREVAAALGGSATLFDMDADGTLDLFWSTASAQHLFRGAAGKFIEVTNQSGGLAAKFNGTPIGSVAGDFDNDGKPDLFVIRDGSLSLYHNDAAGKFSDVTAAASIPAYPFLPSSVAFVDLDHDGDLDIFVTGLADLSQSPKGASSAVFPDDFAAAPNLLLRNDGNGKFSDVTAAARLNSVGHAVSVIPTDFNNRRDMDLLVVNYGMAPALYSNQRDGTFRNVSQDVGLGIEGHWSCAAAGDLNKDGFTDFFFGRADGPGLFAMSDGKEKFKTAASPAGSNAVRVAQFLDYDNDGLLDSVMITDKGLHVWRNMGDGWTDTSERAVARDLASGRSAIAAGRLFAAGDVDNDGDTDLVLSSGGLRIARNDGGNSNHSLRVKLSGKVSNRSSVGAKIEARAGSLLQKLETSSASPAAAPADVIFGLGKRSTADAVRVIWPAGIVQSETEIAKAVNSGTTSRTNFATLDVTELDRKPSSCPYLYAWNGERFEFITDFMGGGEMGYLEEPGRHNTPDPVEYVRIRRDQLKERDGRYELRVTNELEEALFADRFQLIAVDHPQGVEVYPNEGMTDPPRPFKLYVTRAARPPLSAVDDHGNDVLSRITSMDRSYPDDFTRDRIRGYAAEHTLTMKLAENVIGNTASKDTRLESAGTAGVSPATRLNTFTQTSTTQSADRASRFSGRDARGPSENGRATRRANDRLLLLLTGWTDYAWSSDNVAASQAGKSMMLPALQVKDATGQWRTVIEDIGIPVGRPQTVTVDLTGRFLSSSREVRIVTNMRILWDQILVDTSDEHAPLRMMRLDPVNARLSWRGFSHETTPDGREPFGYDYNQVSFASPWKVMPGRYTREGDVRELLLKSDDMFVISRPGDEISLSFDARKLLPLRAGWTRTFLLFSDGFSKEMDINSASPDQVSPLPFHGMTKYPYADTEAYPMTAARRRYIEKYNTRLVTAEVPSIDTVLTITTDFVGQSVGASLPGRP